MSRKLIQISFSILLLSGLLLGFAITDGVRASTLEAQQADAKSDKIEKLLLDRFSAESSADFIVQFSEQADLSPAYSMNWDERGWFVYNTLTEVAKRSQAESKVKLDDIGLSYKTFIAGNELYVWNGNLTTAQTLAELPAVEFIRSTRTYYIDPAVETNKPFLGTTWAGELLANNTSYDLSPDATTDWGIIDTKADQFWGEFGYEGGGIVVANIDTGVQWNHPALDQSFKCGTDPTDPACWEDPSNVCGATGMCDNNGHGTHTMGTMVGDNDPTLTYIVGMAPEAQWIACKGCESSSCSDLALNGCADWVIAPDGNPANRPNVVNNSWGGAGGNNWYQAKVQAWQAAGIFPAFSAGNLSGCGSLGSPGDYQESFGTTGHNSSRVHVYAQGPSSVFGHDPYTKPNISAPASSVCSSVPTNSWNCSYSGTSMASPHSAGAVALLWSCNPSLIGDMDGTFEALQSTADAPNPANPTCGVPPDGQGTNEDGYGYLNVLTMGEQFCVAGWAAINGNVLNAQTSAPVEGAMVTGYRETGGSWSDDTDLTGYYSMTVGAGTYTVEVVHPQFETASVSDLLVLTDTVVLQDFNLQPRGHLYGYVTDQDSGAPLDATVSVAGGPSTDTDPATGYYEFYLDADTYDVTAAAPDYADETASISLSNGQELQHDFTLLAAIAVVPDPIEITLEMGLTGNVASQMTNNMDVSYPFDFKEKATQPGLLVGEDILVVRKDTTAATAMETALTTLGVSYLGITDAAFQAMTVPDLLAYQAVFYAGMTGTSGAPSASENLLVAYLDAGGQLFISDNDLGYYRHGSAFYDTYLQASYIADNGGELLVGENLMAGLDLDVTSDPFPDSFSVGVDGTRIFKWSTADNAGGVFVQRNAYQAIYTSFDFHQIADVADETELINRIVGLFVSSDVLWFDTSISAGTVPAGGTINWTNAFSATTSAGIGQPGDYSAVLRIVPTDDPNLPRKAVTLNLTVLPSADFGQITGIVTSDRPGGPLEANILIEATAGTTVTLTTDPLTGAYSYWLEAGSYDVTASAGGYLPETASVIIVGLAVTPQDFELVLDAPEIVVDPTTLVDTLQFGQTDVQVLTIGNVGLQPLEWELREANAGQILANDILLMADDVSAADWDVYRAALTAAGVDWDEWNLDTLSFPSAAELEPYSVLIWADEDTLISDNAECQIVADWLNEGGKSLFATGMDFLWDIANGTPGSGENNLYVLFNTTYVGDYAGTGITKLNGVAGDLIGADFVEPNGLTLAGTADSNGDYSNLASTAPTGLIYGPGDDGSGASGLTHFEGANYKTVWLGVNFHNGLTVQDQRDTLMSNILSFLGGAGDVPWLSETPISGTLPAGDTVDIDVTFDSSMVSEPGVYNAILRAKNNDPLNNRVDVPVTMTVTPSADVGKIEGIVSGMGYCDGESIPLEAEILIESSTGMTWTVTSDPVTGYYYKWLLADTYTVTASAPDHLNALSEAIVVGTQITILDFDLRLIESCMDVTPTAMTVTVPVDTQLTQTLSIVNDGAGELIWELKETTATLKMVNQDVIVRVPAIKAPDVFVASREPLTGFPARQFSLHIGQVSANPINVLIVTPDVVGGGDITLLLSTLAAFPDLVVTLWDGNAGTPTVADMQAYDVVFVGNDFLWSSSAIDKLTLSNTLADYLDAGGKVLVGSFIWSYDDWGFGGGDFLTFDYSPFEIATTDFFIPAVLGVYDAGSPLMAGVTTITDAFNHQDTALSSNGTWVASWDDDENFVATAPNVVGLNQEYFGSADFGGQTGVLLHNALLYLGGAQEWIDVPWVTEVPTNGVTLPDSTFEVDVVFDATGLTAGECYTAALGLVHDDPGKETPFMIPLNMCVEALEFGVDLEPETSSGTGLPGDVKSYTLQLTNTGNVADSFDLEFSNLDPDWVVELPITSFALGAGESVDVQVKVTIPAGAADGEFDVATITATSTHDSEVFDEVEITTSVEIESFDFFLPLISKS